MPAAGAADADSSTSRAHLTQTAEARRALAILPYSSALSGWDRWDGLLGGVLPSDKSVRYLYQGIKMGTVVPLDVTIGHSLLVQVIRE